MHVRHDALRGRTTILGWDGRRAVVASLAIVTAVVAQLACPFWELVRMFRAEPRTYRG